MPKFSSKINTVQPVVSAHQYYIFILKAKLMKYTDKNMYMYLYSIIGQCTCAMNVCINIHVHTLHVHVHVPSKRRRDPSKNHQLLYQSKYHLNTRDILAQ